MRQVLSLPVGRARGLLMAGCVLIVVAAIFAPVWIQGQLFAHFDLDSLTIPLEDLFRRYQRGGELPLWVPEIQGGYPLLANGVASFFYPPHLLLRALLPGALVANLSLAFHLGLAALGMLLFLRAEGLSRSAAIAGALTVALGGFSVGRFGLAHQLFPAAWVPSVWFLTARFLRTGRRADAVSVVVALSLLVLSGHVQGVVYSLLACAVAAVVFLARETRADVRRTLRRGLALGALLVLVAALTAFHTLPVRELLSQSTRSADLSREELLDVSYPPAHLLTWVFPFAFGHLETYAGAKNEFELASFFGICATILGMSALTARRTYRSPLGILALVLIALGALLALGGASPLYRFLLERPWFRILANPARFFLFTHFGWSLLVALGLSTLVSAPRRMRLLRFGVAVAIVAGGTVALLATLPADTAATVGVTLAAHLQRPFGPSVFLLLLAAATVLIRSRALLATCLSLLLAAELLSIGWRWNPSRPASHLLAPPAIRSALPHGRAASRLLAHAVLFAGPRPDFGFSLGPAFRPGQVLRQSVRLNRDVVTALELFLSWNGAAPQPGDVSVTITAGDGTQWTRTVPSTDVRSEGAWVVFPFDPPLKRTAGEILHLKARAAVPSHPPLYAAFYANYGTDDALPGGVLERCAAGACAPLAIRESVQGPDLAARLRSPPFSGHPYRALLLPMIAESVGVPSARGHLPLQLTRVAAYLRELGERHEGVPPENNALLQKHRALLDRFRIEYLLAAYGDSETLTGLPDVVEVFTLPLGERTARLYQNRRVFPRVHRAATVVPVPAGEIPAVVHALKQERLAPSAVVAERVPFSAPRAFDTDGVLTIVEDRPTRLRLRADAAAESFLVVREVFAPGWQAQIDGRTVPLFITDAVFRGILVPPGAHDILFTYAPAAWKRAGTTSALAGVLFLGYLSLARVWERRRQWPRRRA